MAATKILAILLLVAFCQFQAYFYEAAQMKKECRFPAVTSFSYKPLQGRYKMVRCQTKNANARHSCPPEFTHFKNHCFRFSDNKVSWGDAQTSCEIVGSKLAQPRDAEVNDWLKEELKKRKVGNVWLGADDMFREGEWHWSGGEQLSHFSDWHKGQPDNYKGNEDCLEMWNIKGHFSWNDAACSALIGFVCEKVYLYLTQVSFDAPALVRQASFSPASASTPVTVDMNFTTPWASSDVSHPGGLWYYLTKWNHDLFNRKLNKS